MHQFYTFILRKVTVNRLAPLRFAVLRISFSSLVNPEKHTCTIKTSPNNHSKGLTRRLSSREQTWIHTEVSLFRVSRGILPPNLAEVSSKRKRNDGNVKRNATSCGRKQFLHFSLRNSPALSWANLTFRGAAAGIRFETASGLTMHQPNFAHTRFSPHPSAEKCAARAKISRDSSSSFLFVYFSSVVSSSYSFRALADRVKRRIK